MQNHRTRPIGRPRQPSRRRLLQSAALLGAGAGLGLPALSLAADTYPSKPIRFICPFATGGSADLVTRLVAEQLTLRLGQSVIVENRTGAGGNIGTRMVQLAPPDGYTLLLGYDGTLAVNPHIYRNLPFDTVNDFQPVGFIGDVPLLLLVGPGVPATTLTELVAYSKTVPKGLGYGTPGVGSTQHLMFELIKEKTGANFVHVPYRGAAPAMVDAMGGTIPMVGAALAGSVEYVRGGKLRALAISGTQRTHYFPEVPTLSEAGLTGVSITTWHGLLVPKGTPPAIVTKLNATLNAALRDPKVIERLDVIGSIPAPTTPEGFRDRIKEDRDMDAELVKIAKIEPME
jgi:tripartite-type tricarboxylate transporter receptor subunit TctC